MALIDIWRNNRESIRSYAIRQVVAIAGDGRLKDDSSCSIELRAYLRETGSDKLADYARECLDEAFDDSGLVLQDVVNEIGRRLEFQVEDGRYRGSRTEVAFDGIWRVAEGQAILIEVKTTDTYNVRLDAVADYRKRLIGLERVPTSVSTLFVVGRKDTGALEAQIRGSPYAWDMRVVGVDSLIRLMLIKEKSTAERTVRQIRELLRPFEYTRVDRIVDVVFETAADVEQASEPTADETAASGVEKSESGYVFTSPEALSAMRERIVSALSARFGSSLVRRRQALYETADASKRASISISKRYPRDYQPYWYAFHPAWKDFLEGAAESVHVLGCMDRKEAFAIPLSVLEGLLPKLNQTDRGEGKTYWHVSMTTMDDGGLALYSSRTG